MFGITDFGRITVTVHYIDNGDSALYYVRLNSWTECFEARQGAGASARGVVDSVALHLSF